MARLTEKTVYNQISTTDGGAILGTFVLVRIFRFGTSLFMFHSLTTDRLYPYSEVIRARIGS